MSKLRLIMAVVAVTVFLLSLWAVPAVMVWMAFTIVKTTWTKVALWVLAALWLLLLRPWTMLRDPKWSRFTADLRRAINAIIN